MVVCVRTWVRSVPPGNAAPLTSTQTSVMGQGERSAVSETLTVNGKMMKQVLKPATI